MKNASDEHHRTLDKRTLKPRNQTQILVISKLMRLKIINYLNKMINDFG